MKSAANELWKDRVPHPSWHFRCLLRHMRSTLILKEHKCLKLVQCNVQTYLWFSKRESMSKDMHHKKDMDLTSLTDFNVLEPPAGTLRPSPACEDPPVWRQRIQEWQPQSRCSDEVQSMWSWISNLWHAPAKSHEFSASNTSWSRSLNTWSAPCLTAFPGKLQKTIQDKVES